MHRLLLAAGLCFALAANSHAADPLQTVLAGSQRSAANSARDAFRHPYETLNFFGLQPQMTVVELVPGAGWYSEILAPYLRSKGKLIAAAAPDPASTDANAQRAYERLTQKFTAAPALYDQVISGIFQPPKKLAYAAPASVDMVLTFRNIHNWVEYGDAAVAAVFASAYESLKPGGVFGVVEHRLPEALEQDATASSGYVHESYVIRLAQTAGFELAARSEINANPKDLAIHVKGVWSLPPVYANKDSDRAAYQAIGESDRMTLKFIKPTTPLNR